MKRISCGFFAFLLSYLLGFSNSLICLGQQTQDEPVLKEISLDKKTGVISYELTLPAHVRVRVGIADAALYRTIIDWQEKGQGKHREVWDGKDASGTFRLVGREDLVFTFNYFTEGDEYLRNLQVADILPLSGNLVGRHLPNLEVNRLHKKHSRKFCHEPRISFLLPKNSLKNKDGFYIIKDKTPIEISIDERDKNWFRAERYSIHIFIDDVFVQGELEGYSPYVWWFDPKYLNKGEHLIVINFAGFNDHYGIVSLGVYVEG